MRELFVGLGIRLYARLLKQGFDIIPAQPELILPVENWWESWCGRSPAHFCAKTISGYRVKFSTNGGGLFHRFFHRQDCLLWGIGNWEWELLTVDC
ncbi:MULTISPECIES: hypothetical protein [unclassified Microcoleus]|uniref:hypothetical protein n=1 Tax=unclassified Microcoleus TaxID=2642155 RepID=UPI002FD2798A